MPDTPSGKRRTPPGTSGGGPQRDLAGTEDRKGGSVRWAGYGAREEEAAPGYSGSGAERGAGERRTSPEEELPPFPTDFSLPEEFYRPVPGDDYETDHRAIPAPPGTEPSARSDAAAANGRQRPQAAAPAGKAVQAAKAAKPEKKRKKRHPVLRVLRWFLVPALCLIALAAGMAVGYSYIGHEPTAEVFEWGTWKHVWELIFGP